MLGYVVVCVYIQWRLITDQFLKFSFDLEVKKQNTKCHKFTSTASCMSLYSIYIWATRKKWIWLNHQEEENGHEQEWKDGAGIQR